MTRRHLLMDKSQGENGFCNFWNMFFLNRPYFIREFIQEAEISVTSLASLTKMVRMCENIIEISCWKIWQIFSINLRLNFVIQMHLTSTTFNSRHRNYILELLIVSNSSRKNSFDFRMGGGLVVMVKDCGIWNSVIKLQERIFF